MSASDHPSGKPVEERSALENRFWEKVEIEGGCWEWQGYKCKTGYGHFRVGDNVKRAHRVAWKFLNGEIPDDKQLNHTCNTRSCVNTAHMYLGTQAENVRDSIRHGDMDAVAREDVIEIRERYATEDITQKQLASEYSASQPTISSIIRREVHDFNDD